MTEAVHIEEVGMTPEEFDEHHARTGQCIARVGKLWEQVAEEQQAIIVGQGYKHMQYVSWVEYWSKEWTEASGWSAKTVENWMSARRVKDTTPTPSPRGYEPTGPNQWQALSSLAPEERTEFLDRYDEFKPEPGTTRYPFRDAVRDFKDTRSSGEPTVRELVPPEEMAKLPSPNLSESERWVFQPGKTQMALRRLDPEGVADDAHRLLGHKLEHEVQTIDYVISWYECYKQAILARRNSGLKAVK